MIEAGLVSAAAGLAAYAVRAPGCGWVAPSVCRGDRSRPMIALTFDDGPSESTPVLLDLLDGERARATFFQCGASASRLPAIAHEVSSRGHEIGNHSHTHSRLWLRTPGFIHGELARAQETLETVHGGRPHYFRAPYGVRWPGLGAAQKRLGLTGIMWTALARDWVLEAPRGARRLLGRACNGAIFCLHDGRELASRPDIRETIEMVRRLIPALRERGYEFGTVTEVLCRTTTSSA